MISFDRKTGTSNLSKNYLASKETESLVTRQPKNIYELQFVQFI